MAAQFAHMPTVVKRRVVILAVIALGLAALLAPPATSARQTLVHAFLAKDGTTVVSGYDGGVALTKPTP
jgi:hypothetical protein